MTLFDNFSDLDLFECCFSLNYCFVFGRCVVFACVLLISDVKAMIQFEKNQSHSQGFLNNASLGM